MKRARRRTDIWPRRYRRRPIAAALGVLLAIVLAWAHLSAPRGSDHDRYHNERFTCVNVVDGDTIDLGVPDAARSTTRVRLWGVDTPETAKSNSGAMYYGAEASTFTRSLVLDKPMRVVLARDRTRDKYGRLLAYIYLPDGERMLNEEIIARGQGYADRRFDHPWKERFTRLEEQARKKGAGLWEHVTLEQMPPWRQRYERWAEQTGAVSRASRDLGDPRPAGP